MWSKKCILGVIVSLMFIFQGCFLNQEKELSANDLKQKLDSLENLKESLENEVNGYFSTIEEIEKNIDKVKELKGFISIGSVDGDVEGLTKNNLEEEFSQIVDILKKNQQEVESLRKKLSNSVFRISYLEEVLSKLSAENRQQLENIEHLNQELQKKNELIVQQEVEIKGLSADVRALVDENLEHQQIIQQQDLELHTAWYVFGTYKELKKQQILSRGGWLSAPTVIENTLNKDYFIQIDVRTTTEIPFYSDKAKIRTTHAKSSYTLKKDDNGLFVLQIKNPEEFWAVSKFLVVEID